MSRGRWNRASVPLAPRHVPARNRHLGYKKGRLWWRVPRQELKRNADAINAQIGRSTVGWELSPQRHGGREEKHESREREHVNALLSPRRSDNEYSGGPPNSTRADSGRCEVSSLNQITAQIGQTEPYGVRSADSGGDLSLACVQVIWEVRMTCGTKTKRERRHDSGATWNGVWRPC